MIDVHPHVQWLTCGLCVLKTRGSLLCGISAFVLSLQKRPLCRLLHCAPRALLHFRLMPLWWPRWIHLALLSCLWVEQVSNRHFGFMTRQKQNPNIWYPDFGLQGAFTESRVGKKTNHDMFGAGKGHLAPKATPLQRGLILFSCFFWSCGGLWWKVVPVTSAVALLAIRIGNS